MDELKKSIGYLKEFEKALLEKFHYTVNEDGTYTVTAWKKEYRSENTVIIPPNTTKIERLAFNGWRFKTLVLPEGLLEIGEYAFNSNNGLERVEFPSTLISIGSDAFWNCRNLKEVVFNNGLKEIGKGAFELCSSLEKIVIPKSVEKIEGNAFENCSKLRDIFCEAEEKPEGWDENWLSYFVRGKNVHWGKSSLE